jgi:putative oxidoreductase
MNTNNVSKRNLGAKIAQVVLGLIFLLFGLNGFFNFIPMGSPPTGAAGDFFTGLFKSGYFLPFLKGVEVTCGLLLLVNRFATLALLIIAPVIINILLFHTFLAPEGLPMALVLVGLLGYLAWTRKEAYRHVLTVE